MYYTGPSACVAPYTCVFFDPYFSQASADDVRRVYEPNVSPAMPLKKSPNIAQIYSTKYIHFDYFLSFSNDEPSSRAVAPFSLRSLISSFFRWRSMRSVEPPIDFPRMMMLGTVEIPVNLVRSGFMALASSVGKSVNDRR